MKSKLACGFALLIAMGLLSANITMGQNAPTMRAIFFNNVAHIILQPVLPINLDGSELVPGHPWWEPRIFAIAAGPPPNLNPQIEVRSSIPPRNFFRPPGRFIPSPFETATFSSEPALGDSFVYKTRWPQVFTPSDGRNTVVLTLVDRGRSILFNTDFDLSYSVDNEIIEGTEAKQAVTIQLTPLKPDSSIIIRLRVQSTDQAGVELIAETADPPPSSRTPTSFVWNLTNPAAGETLTFTAQASVQNMTAPQRLRFIPGLLITSSQAPEVLGTATANSVEFPREFLPDQFQSVRYTLSQAVTWRFEHADRTLVDVREVTELVP